MYRKEAIGRAATTGVIRNKKGEVTSGISRRGVLLTKGEPLHKVIQRMMSQNEPIPSEIGVGIS